MARRGTIRNMGRVQKELADARRARAQEKREKAKTTKAPPAETPSHFDYAEEAEAAQRAEAWPQAAALWRRARDTVRATGDLTHLDARNLRRKYAAAADECDDRDRIDHVLEQIAQAKLRIPTLRERKSDGLDFHELGVWSLKRALLAAYQAGQNDAK